MKRIWEILIPGLLLLGAVLMRWNNPAPIQYVQNLVFDAYLRLEPRPYDPSVPVRIAAIDEKALAKFGQWPWSRSTVAKVVDQLGQMGAAAIGIDAIFAEPDRTAPAAIIANLPADAAYDKAKHELQSLPNPDTILAETLKRTPAVIAFSYLDAGEAGTKTPLQSKFSVTLFPGGILPLEVHGGSSYVGPLPELLAAAHGLGDVHSGIADSDGVIRKVPLVVRVGNVLFPTFAADALRIALGGQTAQVRLSPFVYQTAAGPAAGIDKMRIGEAIIPVNTAGEIYLYDTGTQPRRYFSVADLFDPGFDPKEVAGKIVLIGAKVEGLKDLRTTPVTPNVPGVEVHAQVLEQIISGTYLNRPYWAPLSEMGYLIVFGMLVIACAWRASALTGLLIVVIAVTVAIGGSWYAFKHYGFLLDPLYPSGVALVLFMGGTLINFLRTEREKRYVRGAFSRYLSPVLVEQLSEHPERLKLGGEIRELTLMFTDIRGFTKMSEGLDPESLTKVINSFLTPMTRVIQDSKGTIDKYIGDCIMAFWNAPIDVESHGKQAIKAALNMRQELVRLNARFKDEAAAKGIAPIEIKTGIGLNSGLCCVGNLGSEQTFNYSALGDTVNIASRLEALSPAYGVDLVIGEETAEAAPDYAQLELDLVRVKGKLIPIRIFTALGDEQTAGTAEFKALKERHDALIAAYRRQDWDAAEIAIEACRPMAPAYMRGFYNVYAGRVAEFRADPPPADWDGVYVATTKSG
jgi:adenylate cyclase